MDRVLEIGFRSRIIKIPYCLHLGCIAELSFRGSYGFGQQSTDFTCMDVIMIYWDKGLSTGRVGDNFGGHCLWCYSRYKQYHGGLDPPLCG